MPDRGLKPDMLKEDPSEFICFCFYKTRAQIVNAIIDGNLQAVKEVGKSIKAGTNCGNCQKEIQKILDKMK